MVTRQKQQYNYDMTRPARSMVEDNNNDTQPQTRKQISLRQQNILQKWNSSLDMLGFASDPVIRY